MIWTSEGSRRQRFNTTLLKEEPKLNEFKLTLSNKFQNLQDLGNEETTDQNWKSIKEILTTTCEEVFCPREQT